ncbi:hypothetical protein [Achromobacter insuavis]|uniref:hypothetical protein n=1 Tax=Achromobacter insuavis TaxID=1287735 RepID=UPI001F141A8C|nr:hypothetical protein [Achromobacter insuavis]
MTLTVESIEKLKTELDQLPEIDDRKRVLNKREAIAMLVDDVDALRKKGYTYEEIADVLTKHNLAITAATLKGYLSKARSVRPRKPRQKAATQPANVGDSSPKRRAKTAAAESSPPAELGTTGGLQSRPKSNISGSASDGGVKNSLGSGKFVARGDSEQL